MSLASIFAPNLPYVRRFARSVIGSPSGGDALVAAMLEAVIADPSIFPKATTDRIAIYKLLARVLNRRLVGASEPPSATWERHIAGDLSKIAPRPRQALLLVAVEGFDHKEAAEVLDASAEEFSDLLNNAANDVSRQIATDVLIIEDEPLIAMDIEEMVESLGHRVVGTARTHKEATAETR